MAKGDVTLKFDAQTAGFIQDMLKLRAGIDQAAGSTRQFGQDLDKTGAAGAKMAKEVAGSVLSTIGVVTSVGAAAAGAIKLVMGAVENSFARTEERAKLFMDRMQALKDVLGAAGQIGQLPQIEAQLQALAGQSGRSQKEVSAAYAGIHGALGAKASAQDAVAATAAAMQARAAGMGEMDATNVGINYAQLRAKGMGAEGLENVAYQGTVAMRGAMGPGELRMLGESKNVAGTLKMLQAAGMNDESMRGLRALQQTAEERGIGIEDLVAHPEMAPRKEQAAIRSLTAGMGKAGALSTLGGAQAGWAGMAGSEVAQHEKTRAFAAMVEESTGAADAKEAEIRDLREAIYKSQYPTLSLVPGTTGLARHMQTNEEAFATPFGTTPTADETLEILRSIRDNLARQNPGLSNNSAGQK